MDAAVGALRNDAGHENSARDILVGFVGDIFLLFVLDGRNEGIVELRTECLVMIRAVIGVQEQALGNIDLVRITVLVLVHIVREACLGIGPDLFAHVVARLFIVDRTDDRNTVGMIAGDDDQRVGVLVGKFAGCGDCLVEFDRIDDGAVPVQRMGHLVDVGSFDHQEEAVRVLRQRVERDLGHVDEARLIRELRRRALFQEFAVKRRVHVAGVEQAEDLAGIGAGCRCQFSLAGRKHVAGVLEQGDIVLVVLALGSRRRLGQEVGGTAAEQDVRLDVEQHAVDFRLVAALAGMGDDGCGCCVLNFCGRDDADRLLRLAADRFRVCFNLRIVHRVRRAVGIDADCVHGCLVAGHIGRHRVGAVGGDSVRRGRPDKGCRRDVVHRETTVRLALGHALGHDAGSGAMRHGKTVTDQEDHVLGLWLRRGAINVPGHALGFRTSRDFNLVVAGIRDRQCAQHDGGTEDLVLVLLFCNELDILAEHRLVVLAVDGDLDVLRLHDRAELDLEIEWRAGQDRRPIKRKDVRGVGGLHAAGKNCGGCKGSKKHTHGKPPSLRRIEVRG